jgi:hypothetical protein
MNIRQTRHFVYWIAYTIVAPIGLIIAVWAIGHLIQDPSGSFAEVFGTGDLLPLAALLFLSSSADIRMAEENTIGRVLTIAEVAFLILGTASIAAYAVLKLRGLELIRMSPNNPEVETALAAFGRLSWAFVGTAVALTVPVKAKLLVSD